MASSSGSKTRGAGERASGVGGVCTSQIGQGQRATAATLPGPVCGHKGVAKIPGLGGGPWRGRLCRPGGMDLVAAPLRHPCLPLTW